MSTWAQLLDWMAGTTLGNSRWRWVAAAAAALAVFAILLRLRQALKSRTGDAPENAASLRALAAAAARRTYVVFLLAAGLLAGSYLVDLGAYAETLRRTLMVATWLQAGAWGVGLLDALLARWQQRKAGDPSAPTVGSALRILGRLVVWSLVLLLSLDNLGVKVTALLAGLGVGGIAVALAVQNILGDLFSSVSILLDKPFEFGDFIVVGDLLGTVEHIGLKTTRVRSLSGEQLIFSNSDLLSSRIRNFKRMSERRVVFSIGVTYETPAEKVAAIPGLLRAIVEARPGIRFDRAHFQKFGDFALIYEVVYYVKSPDYTAFMDLQQDINLAIFGRFEEEGVEFAYPTQTLILRGGAPALSTPTP